MKQLSFIVTVQYPDHLEDQVVRNYVQMAIKKYDKLVYSIKQMSYFDGLPAYLGKENVGFHITEVAANKDDIRELVKQINTVNKHFEAVER